MKHALMDTGIWYAMCDHRDEHHAEARNKIAKFDAIQLIAPWPTLYETLRTRFVKNSLALQTFEQYLKRSKVSYLDDAPYRKVAMEICLESSLRAGRPLSMVDCLLRLILEDRNVKTHALATFNPQDFIDICTKYRIEMM